MLGKIAIFLVLPLIAATSIFGGDRGPGEYSGTVIFDSWDTCYIYSGIYLMYVAESKKELLRQYEGLSIRINATEVFQPINPGDGLITEFKYLGAANVDDHLPDIGGLNLKAISSFDAGTRFRLIIQNTTNQAVVISTEEIAPTLLRKKLAPSFLSPSDGFSDAKITRCSFRSDMCHQDSMRLRQEPISARLSLPAGRTKSISISLTAPAGDYDFLLGYGGGVHDARGIASNIISFSIDRKGKARLASRETLLPKEVQNPLEKLFFSSFAVHVIRKGFYVHE